MAHFQDRAFHLIDLENVGDGRVSDEVCERFLARYRALSIVGAHDQVVIGVSITWLPYTTKLPLTWRRVVGPARVKDSADMALLDALPETHRLPTFPGGLVICSRDNVFERAAALAHAHGLTVTVVASKPSREGALLSAAADRHLYLDRQASGLAA